MKCHLRKRVKVSSIRLEGEAIAWHISYLKARIPFRCSSATEYIFALNERLREGFEDPMEAIKNVKQTGM